MEVTGVVEKVLETRSGVSAKGANWSSTDVVIKTSDEYDNLRVVSFFNKALPSIGDNIVCDVNIKTREWNDKYFTSLALWKGTSNGAKIEDSTGGTPTVEAPKADAPASDDLPF